MTIQEVVFAMINKPIKVLSLFDGMSCGQIALDQLGIKVDTYYASEIDKYGIEITQKNYPNTVQVGDITKLDPKDFADIDLIMGGSPCQGFSFAGKQLAFDDPRSVLFFEFIRLLKAIKPKYFLLENVRMKKEFIEVITQQVSECYPDYTNGLDLFGGRIEPILINSSLVSAQSRQRLYWTNILGIEQPEERGIVLRDILENDVDNEFYHGKKSIEYMERGNDKWQQAGARRADRYEQTADKKKSFTITENWHKGVPYNYFKETKPMSTTQKKIEKNKRDLNEKAVPLLASTYKGIGNNGTTLVPTKPKKAFNIPRDILKDNEMRRRVYSSEGKSPTIISSYSPKIKTKPKQVGKLIEQVKVRKHEVDIPKLQTCILDHYAKCGKNKKEIAKELNDKYSTVEHYFRKLGSNFFCIPSEEHWPQLKKILGIETNKFDKQIMEFEFRDGVFETKQRVYSDEGKSPTLTHGSADKLIQVGVAADINGHDILKRVYSPEGKGPTLSTCGGGNTEPKVVTGGAFRGRAYDEKGQRMDRDGNSVANKTKQMLELRKDNKSNAITTVGKDSVVVDQELTWRKLTPLECERLQTVPDNYTEGVSNTQRYKMLGNGWTVEVIKHILSNMTLEKN